MSATSRQTPRPRDGVRALTGYHSPQVDVPVRLNTNESPYPPPDDFLAAWLGALRTTPMHRYPDRATSALRERLGGHLGQPPERLLCANGSNEVLQALLLAYGGASRRALVFEPTYALHSHIARITGTEVVEGGRRADFTVDVDHALGLVAAHEPSLVFLCSPNNPTGGVEPRATVDALLDATDAIVVVDEAYGELAESSCIDLVDDERPLVVTRTYSKVWSMAALRLGFGAAPPWLIADLEKVILPYHLSAPVQLAGTLALDFAAEMKDRVGRLVEERARVSAALRAIDGVRVFPSGANFVLVRIETGAGEPTAPGDRGHATWQGLLERGVLVRDFSRREHLTDCLRVTIGTPDENDRFLDALDAVLAGTRAHEVIA